MILFDAECPMCTMATKVFESGKLLDKDGRASYQDFEPEVCPLLDRQRAANEIAFVNKETGEVTYGIDGLLTLFSIRFPILKQLFLFRPFVRLMSKAYAL